MFDQVVAVAVAGATHALALGLDGTVWASGSGNVGGVDPGCGFGQIPNLSLAPNAWLLTDDDGDGLPVWREYLVGTDPLDVDSDDDGFADTE